MFCSSSAFKYFWSAFLFYCPLKIYFHILVWSTAPCTHIYFTCFVLLPLLHICHLSGGFFSCPWFTHAPKEFCPSALYTHCVSICLYCCLFYTSNLYLFSPNSSTYLPSSCSVHCPLVTKYILPFSPAHCTHLASTCFVLQPLIHLYCFVVLLIVYI